MKGIIQYNLPEEQDEFEMAQKGSLYRAVLDELDNELRKVTKYNMCLADPDKLATDEEIKMAEYLRDYLIHLLDS